MSSGPAKLLVARSSPTPLKFESSGGIPCGDALSRRLSELRSSSLSGGTAAGGKEHEGCTLSYSTAGKYHLHLGKTSLPALESSANVLQSSFQMKKEFTA